MKGKNILECSPPIRITAVRPLVCDTGLNRYFLFVLVDTDVGITGVGEGSQSNQEGAVVAAIHQLAAYCVGRDPRETVEPLVRRLWNARTGRAIFIATSALEQALWDIIGKALGVPVFQLLGGSCWDALRCYATLSTGLRDFGPVALAEEAERCVTAGYTAVKIAPFDALGPAGAWTADARSGIRHAEVVLRAVRTAVGPDIRILVESDFRFDLNAAMQVGLLLQEFDCYWFEAPLLWDDTESLRRLRSSLRMRVASGETLHGRGAYREIIENRAVDVLQPDVKWTGGILEAKKIASWAETYQIGIAPHNNSGPVATAASAQLAMSLPNFLLLEVPSRAPAWQKDLVKGTFPCHCGDVSLSTLRERPGLGIAFDEQIARQYQVVEYL